jgi:hypothetical protein
MGDSSLRDIRERVATLRSSLLQPSPDTIQAEATCLRVAAEALATITNPSPLEANDLNSLAQDLQACRTLIEHGLTTAQVLSGILATSAGYSPTGGAPPLTVPGTLSVQG